MNNKHLFGVIALDLDRAANWYNNGYTNMADKFLEETYKRINLLNQEELPEKIKRAIQRIREIKNEKNLKKRAEYALTYSTILLSFAK